MVDVRFTNGLPVQVVGLPRATQLLTSPNTRDEVGAVISIANLDIERPPEEALTRVPKVLKLTFADTTVDVDGYRTPCMQDVVEILDFNKSLNTVPNGKRLLVHCMAGVSRSAAATYIMAADLYGRGNEVQALICTQFAAESLIRPNRLMVHLADDLLCRDGAMLRALDQYIAAQLASERDTAILVKTRYETQENTQDTGKTMGLLDNISSAKGTAGANYGKKGRHIVRVSKVIFREPDALNNIKAMFAVDGQLLKTTNPEQMAVGESHRYNDSFKFPNSSLAAMRRSLTALRTASGEPTTEADITTKESERLTGPDQPLRGTIIVVNGVEKKNQTNGNAYTLFEFEVPNDDDLKAVGVL